MDHVEEQIKGVDLRIESKSFSWPKSYETHKLRNKFCIFFSNKFALSLSFFLAIHSWVPLCSQCKKEEAFFPWCDSNFVTSTHRHIPRLCYWRKKNNNKSCTIDQISVFNSNRIELSFRFFINHVFFLWEERKKKTHR